MKQKAPFLLTGDPTQCCACGACRQICPKNCITMEEKDGFLRPKIHEHACIDCGLCGNVCQYVQLPSRPDAPLAAWAAYHTDEQIHSHSTSGGMFPALAQYTLRQGGVVFGAGWNEDLTVSIQPGERWEACRNFSQSKYVFSDTGDTYTQVKDLLKAGRRVLYTGTPCQVAGLRRFLGQDYENLLTMDVICHGFPSRKAFRAWLREQEHSGGKVCRVTFRSKSEEDTVVRLQTEFADGRVQEEPFFPSSYANVFFSHVALQPACNHCLHTNLQRVSDITVGDFWGAKTEQPDAYHPRGTSAVIVNTEKGAAALDAIRSELHCVPTSTQKLAAHNPPLRTQAGYNPLSRSFLKALDKMSFSKAHQRYVKIGNVLLLPYRAVRKLRKKLRRRA